MGYPLVAIGYQLLAFSQDFASTSPTARPPCGKRKYPGIMGLASGRPLRSRGSES